MVMVKELRLYECDICGCKWESLDAALSCEAKGTSQSLPDGLIFGRPVLKENSGQSLTVTDPATFCLVSSVAHGHLSRHKSLAFRDNGYGDDDPNANKYCDTSVFLPLSDRNIPNPNWECFQRLVRALYKRLILSVWNGNEAIPLKEFLRGRELNAEVDYGFIQE